MIADVHGTVNLEVSNRRAEFFFYRDCFENGDMVKPSQRNRQPINRQAGLLAVKIDIFSDTLLFVISCAANLMEPITFEKCSYSCAVDTCRFHGIYRNGIPLPWFLPP